MLIKTLTPLCESRQRCSCACNVSDIQSGDEKKIYFTPLFFTQLTKGAKKRSRFVSLYLLRVQINIAENAHAKIHTATSVPCVHFQFSFRRDGEVTHTHEHPKKSYMLFLVYFQPPFWCLKKALKTSLFTLFLSLLDALLL